MNGLETTTDTDKGKVFQPGKRLGQSSIRIDDRSQFYIKAGIYTDEIDYRILTPEEEDIDKIRIEFEDNRHTKVNSELGRLIYDTLRERFTDRQLEEEQTEAEQQDKQKTGAEQIIDFVQENGFTPHDISVALTTILARSADRDNAVQHLVQQAEKGQEEINKNEQNQE